MPRPCAIASCEQVIPDTARESTTYCVQCRSSMSAWIKRPTAHILRRKANLEKYRERMNTIGVKSNEKKRRK